MTAGARIRAYALCAVYCVVHRLDLVLWRQNAGECDISDYTHSCPVEAVRSHPPPDASLLRESAHPVPPRAGPYASPAQSSPELPRPTGGVVSRRR
ncbi:hypothetical protein GCM10010519_26060 [Streptomyces lactacystinicus]